jgi:hypothetical protein
VTIAVSNRPVSPFSWRRTIVLSQSDYQAHDEALLAHEMGHIRNHHSVDVIFMEIGRRGYECIIKKTKQFYPELKLKDVLIDQWKDKINIDNFKTWKDLFNFIKNLELRYRVSTGVVFSKFKTNKSLVGYISHQSYLCV